MDFLAALFSAASRFLSIFSLHVLQTLKFSLSLAHQMFELFFLLFCLFNCVIKVAVVLFFLIEYNFKCITDIECMWFQLLAFNSSTFVIYRFAQCFGEFIVQFFNSLVQYDDSRVRFLSVSLKLDNVFQSAFSQVFFRMDQCSVQEIAMSNIHFVRIEIEYFKLNAFCFYISKKIIDHSFNRLKLLHWRRLARRPFTRICVSRYFCSVRSKPCCSRAYCEYIQANPKKNCRIITFKSTIWEQWSHCLRLQRCVEIDASHS